MVVNKMESIFTKYLSSLFFLQIFVSFSLFCTFVALFVHYRLFLFCRSLKLHSLLFSLCSLSYFIYTSVCVFVCEYRYFFLFYSLHHVFSVISNVLWRPEFFISVITFNFNIFTRYIFIICWDSLYAHSLWLKLPASSRIYNSCLKALVW